MNIESWMKEVEESLKNIEAILAEMCSLTEKTFERIVSWHKDDNVHHKEENNLIKKTFKRGKDG